MIGDIAERIKQFTLKALENTPFWAQVAFGLFFLPVVPLAWVQAMTNIVVVGVFIPFFVLEKTLELPLQAVFLGGVAWHVFSYASVVVHAAWIDSDKGRSLLVPFLVYAGTLAVAFLGWLVSPLFV